MQESAPPTKPVPADASSLVLEPRLGVQNAAALTREFRALQGRDLEVDASEVVALSTACLQVLLAAARSWREEARLLRIVEPSPALLATLYHLGLDLKALQSCESAPCH